jgi:hypothetical protein
MHKGHELLPGSTERVGRGIIGAAIAMHRSLGPGLLESAYETCLAHELERRGNAVRLGFLINFNLVLLKQGVKRMIL